MAVPQVITNAGQLTLNWSGLTRTWHNVLGFHGNPTLPTIDQAFADTLFTAIRGNPNTTAFMAVMGTLTILESISVRSLNAPNQPVFTSAGTALAGGATGDNLPLSVAACVTLRTALAGKSFRGRVYLTGFTETSNDASGRITAAANGAAHDFVVGITSALLASGCSMAVLSRPAAAITIPAVTIAARPGMANGVTVVVVRNTKWESQRRRTGRA